jgi:hypothetical protein
MEHLVKLNKQEKLPWSKWPMDFQSIKTSHQVE